MGGIYACRNLDHPIRSIMGTIFSKQAIIAHNLIPTYLGEKR